MSKERKLFSSIEIMGKRIPIVLIITSEAETFGELYAEIYKKLSYKEISLDNIVFV